MIGLSLSFCVRDIASGKISEEEVEVIITGTCARYENEWYDLIERYCASYWKEFPEEARGIAVRLMREGKIHQPRVENQSPPNLSEGHWC